MPIDWNAMSQEEIDIACRARDAHNLHISALGRREAAGKYIAIKLEDGSSDGVLYDTRNDAVRHHRNRANRYFYWRINPVAQTMRQSWVLIYYKRQMSRNGVNHEQEEALLPVLTEQVRSIIPRAVLPHLR